MMFITSVPAVDIVVVAFSVTVISMNMQYSNIVYSLPTVTNCQISVYTSELFCAKLVLIHYCLAILLV